MFKKRKKLSSLFLFKNTCGRKYMFEGPSNLKVIFVFHVQNLKNKTERFLQFLIFFSHTKLLNISKPSNPIVSLKYPNNTCHSSVSNVSFRCYLH